MIRISFYFVTFYTCIFFFFFLNDPPPPESPPFPLPAPLPSPYTMGLWGPPPRPDAARERPPTIGGRVPTPNNQPKGCRFAPRCPFADRRCRQEPPPFREVTP